MRKKLIVAAFLCAGTCLTSAGVTSRGISAEGLRSDVEYLCSGDTQGRGTGTRGGVEASFYLIRRFRQEGLIPFKGSFCQSFTCDSLCGHNVLGMLEGKHNVGTPKYIIIGAHFDNLGTINGKTYPGADSNASGVAAMLSIARLFHEASLDGATFSHNIIFVAFDGYYEGRKGAETLWRAIEDGELSDPVSNLTITPSKIKLMVDIDQIGSTLSPISPNNKRFIMAIGEKTLPVDKRGLLMDRNIRGRFRFELSSEYCGSSRFTEIFYKMGDRRVFIKGGVPTIYFTSGITHFNNTEKDVPSSLDYSVFRDRCLFMYSYLEKFAGR